MSHVVVVAPHPDDETLGCGGTLLRHREENNPVHWILMTDMAAGTGYDSSRILRRKKEIARVSKAYGFASVHSLGYAPAALDRVGRSEMVKRLEEIFKRIKPEILYLPYAQDAHSDHRHTAEAAMACSKWFRCPSIKKILAYETLSETDFKLRRNGAFQPNVFVNIEKYLQRKIRIMGGYRGEMQAFPFPRSAKAIQALAEVRGAAAGFKAAEAFLLLKEIQ